MGAWGSGPFDNDTAADWAGEYDDASPAGREALVRRSLPAKAPTGSVDEWETVAIAAAAVVAALLPGGPTPDPVYGPQQLVPGQLPAEDLAPLASVALAHAVAAGTEWHASWSEAGALDEALSALQPIISALIR